MKFPRFLFGVLAAGWVCTPAMARDFTSTVMQSDEIARVRPDFKLPDEPNQLFYIERSVNSNTVVYTASLDPQGVIDPKAPVDAYWRWFNVDGHKKPLNFVERMMAYGVHVDRTETGKPPTFSIVPLPERKITLAMGADHRPEARMKIGDHIVRLAYVYLNVIDGLIPKVPSLDIFGTDIVTGKAIQEHLVQK